MAKKARYKSKNDTADGNAGSTSNEADTGSDGNSGKILSRLTGSLDEALEGAATDIEPESLPENISGAGNAAPPRKQHAFSVLGVFILLFSVIGAVTFVNAAAREIASIAGNRGLIEKTEHFIYPVVISDPPQFTSAAEIPSRTMISSAVWNIILSGNADNYPKDLGLITIPAPDVESAARKLFGYGDYAVEHRTVDNIDIIFEYSAENNSYTVPVNPRYMSYSPEIETLTKEKVPAVTDPADPDYDNKIEVYRAEVNYIAPSPLALAGIGYVNEPVKKMVYKIVIKNGVMSVAGIDRADEQLIINNE